MARLEHLTLFLATIGKKNIAYWRPNLNALKGVTTKKGVNVVEFISVAFIGVYCFANLWNAIHQCQLKTSTLKKSSLLNNVWNATYTTTPSTNANTSNTSAVTEKVTSSPSVLRRKLNAVTGGVHIVINGSCPKYKHILKEEWRKQKLPKRSFIHSYQIHYLNHLRTHRDIMPVSDLYNPLVNFNKLFSFRNLTTLLAEDVNACHHKLL